MRRVVLLLVSAAILLAEDPQTRDARFFDKRVAPILARRCLSCHGSDLDNGGLSFQDRATLFKKPVVVPGKPEESLLILAIRHTGDIKMPPGPRLPDKDIAILIDWVKRGVPWGSKLRGSP